MSEKEEYLTVRNTMTIGMASAALFVILNIIGILIDGDWRPYDMICELGRSDSIVVSTLFTVNCIISGIGMIVCGYGIARRRIRPWVTLAYICVSLIGVSLMVIGIFDMDSAVHEPFAFGLAFMMGITMTVMSVDDILYHRYGWVIVSITIASGLLGVLIFIPEYGQSISLVTMLSWTLFRFGSCAKVGKV